MNPRTGPSDSTVLPSTIDVLVVGAGHAGLTMSKLLGEAGREHVVVDGRDRLGGGWQDRWDDFRLVTPNWTASFPGWAYDGPDPDGFTHRDEITDRVARYADVVGAPVAPSSGRDRPGSSSPPAVAALPGLGVARRSRARRPPRPPRDAEQTRGGHGRVHPERMMSTRV